ncbi:MAG: DUF262 domain-containing protein [Myxococcota bacterium]
MDHVLTLQSLFANRLFRVPAYQRGYAWEKRHRDDFLSDLELLGEGKDHYTGTIVLHRCPTQQPLMDEGGAEYAPFDVVDGQQRLTTTTLLLDAVCRAARNSGLNSLADGIGRSYIALRGHDGRLHLRLALNPDCRDFWSDVILAASPSPLPATIQSHRRLADAKAGFDEYLAAQRERLGAGWTDWLWQTQRKLTQQLKFTLYEVSSTAEVGVIFEVMNNRGQQLSELDKVKNYLLYLATKLDFGGEGLAEGINGAWANILECLMAAGLTRADDENAVLRVHWLVTQDADARHWQQVQSVKQRFALRDFLGRHGVLLSQLEEYVRSLRDVARVYAEAARPARQATFGEYGLAAAQVQHASEKLVRIGTLAAFLPLLVATRLRFPGDGAKYEAMVWFCERFAFRVYGGAGVAQWRSHTGQSFFRSKAYALRNKGLDFDAVMGTLYWQLLDYEPDARFGTNLRRFGDDCYAWPGIRYFLYEYEEHLAKGHGVRLSWAEIEKRDLSKTIEHILPQTPSDAYWKARFTADDLKKWTHDFANLVLTQHNGALGHKSFDRKKGDPQQVAPCYANSVLLQERALSLYAEWGPASLQDRRDKLIDWALERWAVPREHVGIAIAAQPVPCAIDDHDDGDDADEFDPQVNDGIGA